MKICFIADGRSIHTQRWIEYFARHHEVHLITYDPMNISIEGVTEHVVGSSIQNLYLSFWPRHFRILRLTRQIDPDIIHAHFIAKYGFHLPFLAVRPAIVSAWGDDILILPKKSRLIRMFTRHVLNYADLIYAVSRDIQHHIVNDFGIPPEKITYMPFGIDTNLFAPVSNPGRETAEIILFSNRGFYPVYDMETLIRGFAIAYRKEKNLRLILKGEGPERGRMQGLVDSLGIEGVVTFREKTAYADVPQDYRAADIFVTTSVSDGTPVSLLEAMASGLPCIATAVGGIPEWITDGENGVLIPPQNPEALAESITRLADAPDLRNALGARARRSVVEAADWQAHMAKAEHDYTMLTHIDTGAEHEVAGEKGTGNRSGWLYRKPSRR